jgi:DNA-binding transcriptional ArsR family regulator
MKKLQEQLARISQTLSILAKQVSQITQQVGKWAPPAAGKPGRGTAQKGTRGVARVRRDTVLDSVFEAIKHSRSGISIVQLKKKTDLGDRQLSNALYKLTKKGLVYAKSRGVYVKS